MNVPKSEDTFSQVTEVIRAEPASSQALILYALVNTLAYSKSGCLFKLDKLKDLTEENRQLAYGLINIMASNPQAEPLFQSFKTNMDEIVRGA